MLVRVKWIRSSDIMIFNFHIKNFRSIIDLNISFRYGEKKAPNRFQEMDSWPFLTDGKERAVPCLAIYGANASGKSNVILALSCLDDLITKGVNREFFQPNKLHPELIESEFEIEYSYMNHFFKYRLAYDKSTILEEVLLANGEELFSVGLRCEPRLEALAREGYSAERLLNIYKVECCDELGAVQKSSFLGKVGNGYSGLNATLTAALRFWQLSLQISQGNKLPTGMGLRKITQFDEIEKNDYLSNKFKKIIRQMDVGIQDVRYKNVVSKGTIDDELMLASIADEPCSLYRDGDETGYDIIQTTHADAKGNEVKFNVKEESDGTQVLFGLLPFVLFVLELGQVLVIDEIDRSLHPLIVRELIRMFKDKDYNKNGAQLVFTTHTTDLLDDDLLRVSEVAIVNKTLKKGSSLMRLCEVEEIRNVTSFRRRYLNGEFRGIPYPYL